VTVPPCRAIWSRGSMPLALVLAACGGDGGADPVPPPPPLPPPSLILSVSASPRADTLLTGEGGVVDLSYSLDSNASSLGGTAAVDSIQRAYTVNGTRLVASTLATPPPSPLTDSLPVVADSGSVLAEYRVFASASNREGRQTTREASSSTRVAVLEPVEMVEVSFDTRLFFDGGINDSVMIRVLDPHGGPYEGTPVNGRLTMTVPRRDSLLVEPVAMSEGTLHRIAGRSHQYHLASVEGGCFVTDAYAPVLSFPFPSDVVRLETVPTSVSALLAMNTGGRRSGINLDDRGRSSTRGNYVTLDRSQPHRLVLIDGPVVADNPFEMNELTDRMREDAALAVDAEHRLFSHPSIPEGCAPYGSSIEEVRDFLRFETMTPQTFLDSLWDGRIGGGGAEPTIPAQPDFVHLTYNQGRARASTGYSLRDDILHVARSRTAVPMNGMGNFLSENKRLAPADSFLQFVCSHNNRILVSQCYVSGVGPNPAVFDTYAAPWFRDEVAARLLGHVFGVAMENNQGRAWFAFRNEDAHWLSATRLDNQPPPWTGNAPGFRPISLLGWDSPLAPEQR